MANLSTRHDPSQGWVYLPEARTWVNPTTGATEVYNRHGQIVDRWTPGPNSQAFGTGVPQPGTEFQDALPGAYQNSIPGANEIVPRIGAGNVWSNPGFPLSPYLTGNFPAAPDYGELTAWANSMGGWPQSGTPSVGGNMQLGGFGGTPPATGFDASLGQPMNPYSGPFGGWNYFGGGQPSTGGSMSLGGNLSIGQGISPFQDLWSPVNFGGGGGSASAGGNMQLGGYGGGTGVSDPGYSPGPEISPFQDLWASINNGVQGGPSQGGDMSLGGNDYSPGPAFDPFQDLWSPIAPSPSQGSASQGGTDIANFGGDTSLGSDIPSYQDLWSPVDYNSQATNTWQNAVNQYGYGGFYYDAQGNVVPLQAGGGGGGQGTSRQGQTPSPILDLTGILHQNLSARPPSDISAMPFAPGQTNPYLNAAGEIVIPSGTGFGYSPSSVYNAAGQYIGANFTGSFAGQATGIGGIMGSGNTWNMMSATGMQDTTGDGFGGQAVTQGRGEGPAFQVEDLGGHVFHFGGPVPGPTGHQGHLVGKVF